MTPPPGYETDRVTRLEVNLDDVSPEVIGHTFSLLLAAGALDVWLTPIQMKKGRPGTLLSVLCEEAQVPGIADLIFRETGTLGLRLEEVLRLKLQREVQTVLTPYGGVRVKLGIREGQVVQRTPEYESCRALSVSTGHPLRTIYEAALLAAQALMT